MARAKEQEMKEYLIAQRKKMGTGVSGAPVWAQQKAGKRIWNIKMNKHWRRTDFGHSYRKENDLL